MSWLVGPWRRRDNTDGTINPIPARCIPLDLLRTVTLACGWFDFHPGSTLGVSGGAHSSGDRRSRHQSTGVVG
jgi:ammonia channel protein AmtB